MLDLLILPFLLVLNALLVMGEIAIVASRKVRLEQAAERGEPAAARALDLVRHPTRYIATIQIGITIIGILVGAMGEASLADRFEVWLAQTVPALAPWAAIISLVVVVVSLTLVMLIFGEILPKRLAMLAPETIARGFAAPIRFFALLTAPLVWLLSRSTDLIVAALGLRTSPDDEVNEDEIRGMIEKGTQTGVFGVKEGEIVDRVFQLGDRRVKSLMVPRSDVVWLEADTTPERVRLIVATSPHSHFPVCRGGLDNVLGVVHVKDMVKLGLVAGADINITELARPTLFVPENTLALKLLERFRETRNHLAIVVDEYGGTEGLVTLNDLVEAMVGDVVHTHQTEPEIVRRDDGTLLIDGRLPLDDLARALDLPTLEVSELGLSAAEVTSVAGLVLALLGHLPREGESVIAFDLRFEVVDMDRQRIDKVLISRRPTLVEQPSDEAQHPS